MKPLFFLLTLSTLMQSQTDSTVMVSLVGIHVSGQMPFEDLAKRFGPNLNAGGSYMLKTKKNWIFGIESGYMFGRNVKEDVTTQLKNSEGTITDNEGYPADLRITERGLGVHMFVGRVFNLASANTNSGLMVNIGGGYLQHKINLYDAQQKIAAVKGTLRYGYDRLSAGFSLTQFVGYLFLSNNRLLNFYGGFEFYEAFTKSVRKINYDTGLRDTRQRMDVLGGVRIGWILPLYKKAPNDYYYN